MKTSQRHKAWTQASILVVNRLIQAGLISRKIDLVDQPLAEFQFYTADHGHWWIGYKDIGWDEIVFYFAIEPRQWRPGCGTMCFRPYNPVWADLYATVWLERRRGFYLQTLYKDGKQAAAPGLRARRSLVAALAQQQETPLGFSQGPFLGLPW